MILAIYGVINMENRMKYYIYYVDEPNNWIEISKKEAIEKTARYYNDAESTLDMSPCYEKGKTDFSIRTPNFRIVKVIDWSPFLKSLL